MSHQNVNFLFATHLHQLSQMERITSLNNVKMFHLKVKFDELTGDLIYDRRLEAGCVTHLWFGGGQGDGSQSRFFGVSQQSFVGS